jgi:hypothetical protein
MRPTASNDEAGHLTVTQFRVLLAQLIGAPSTVPPATSTRAYAPSTPIVTVQGKAAPGAAKKKQPAKRR